MLLLFISLCFYYLLFVFLTLLLLHIQLCYLLSFSLFPLFFWKLCYISSLPLVVTVSFPMLISKTVFLCYIKARHQIVYPHKSYPILPMLLAHPVEWKSLNYFHSSPRSPSLTHLLLQYFPPLDFAEIIIYFSPCNSSLLKKKKEFYHCAFGVYYLDWACYLLSLFSLFITFPCFMILVLIHLLPV